MASRRHDETKAEVPKPPERGPEIRVRMLLAAVGPEVAGDEQALERPVVHREKRDEPLDAERQLELASVQVEPEALQERERHSARVPHAFERGWPTCRQRAHLLPGDNCRRNDPTVIGRPFRATNVVNRLCHCASAKSMSSR